MHPIARARTATDFAAAVVELYETAGSSSYDEAVTQRDHALQCALLVRAEGLDEGLVVAGLLHDIGHLLIGEHAGKPEFLDEDRQHQAVGARVLCRWYPPEITVPIRQHVNAKRYLCTVEAYHATLSRASQRSLRVQGGLLSDSERLAFEGEHADRAVTLRRLDDRAKQVGVRVPPFSDFLDLLAGAVRRQSHG